ncbi:MAG: hypothetical protein IPK13_14890 [Deltaproteobacteria bacterium]|nr:hypothetical protein [Deltaproteobacteria bacterium]
MGYVAASVALVFVSATSRAAPAASAASAVAKTEVADKEKATLEGRGTSKVTEGTPSRWSNRGAMTPIESEVPIAPAAPLPERSIPVAAGVETPGQSLTGHEELLSARLSLGFYRLSTNTLDRLFYPRGIPAQPTTEGGVDESKDYDIEFLRARVGMAYERIGGSDLGLHLDLEYRPRIAGSRLTDQRINELYVSYGLTDFHRRGNRSSFGLALGRVAVREAGYAQADGLLLRFRVSSEPSLVLGLFGGFSGNPYGYNWARRTTELFSTNWMTGGVFGQLHLSELVANFAAVGTYANLPADEARNLGASSGLERLYVYVDVAYQASASLNFFVTGFINAYSGGEALQRLEAVGAYRQDGDGDWALTVSLARFSTLLYALTAEYSYEVDPFGNRVGNLDAGRANQVIVDAEGRPIATFDAALYSAVYNQATVRAGYRLTSDLEGFVRSKLLLRDLGATRSALRSAGIETAPDVASLRFLPSVGVQYRNKRIVDASVEMTYVQDAASQADGILQAGVGRGLFGLYLGLDGRLILGTVRGIDVGSDLSYTLPRDWFPGQVMVHGTVRYFRERIPGLGRPRADQNFLNGEEVLESAARQVSWLGFAGLEWRL